MVTALQEEDRPQPWVNKGKSIATSTRETRTSSRATASKIVQEKAKSSKVIAGSRGGRQTKPLPPPKGMKITTMLPPASAEVVLGQAVIPNLDVQERQKKTEQDAAACGRIVKKIQHPATRQNCSTTKNTMTSDDLECAREPPPRVAAAGGNSKGVQDHGSAEPAHDIDAPQQDETTTKNTRISSKRAVASLPGNRVGSVSHTIVDPTPSPTRQPTQSPTTRPTPSPTVRHARHEDHIDPTPSPRLQRHSRNYGPSDHVHSRYESAYSTRKYHVENYSTRRAILSISPRERARRERSPISLSLSPRPRGHGYRERHASSSPSYRRSRSPRRRGDREVLSRSRQVYREEYGRSDRASRQYRRSRSRSPQHRLRRSISEDSGRRGSRSRSPSRRHRRHTWVPPMSRSPSPPSSTPRVSRGKGLQEPRRGSTVQVEYTPVVDAAEDRKSRRKRQAAREEEIARRERDGKKAFYLTVDAEGKPYGLGKPAWVAEIGKLATGLDPSCTHISRQTYEAVTTLKARLNDSFEYSGKLNDDYLRSIMGKAVTKKRTELISLIKRGESQPLHIDHEVWERLVKLADSKQRKDKSEQGRYANACRKTYGRTGSAGINGVRERLKRKLQRSPDPEEVGYEMDRIKDYGRGKEKIDVVKVEKGSGAYSAEPNTMSSDCDGRHSYQSSSDDHQGRSRKKRDTYNDKGENASSKRHSFNRENSDISKDMIIKELRDEINRLKAESAKGAKL